MSNTVMGIDLGSAYSKGILRNGQTILASNMCPSGGNLRHTAEDLRNCLLSQAGLIAKDIAYIVATGYGSKSVTFADETVTDISSHGKGIYHLYPAVRTVVDIGDLYSKAFRIDGNGNLINFVLSGKCAGGSARILKVIAKVMQIKLEDVGPLSLKARKRVEFSTGCAVFTESEAISRIAEGAAKEDLLAGLHWALGAQLNSLAERVGIEKDYALVGGGARDTGLVKALEEMNGFQMVVPEEPHMNAALGAAIIASEHTLTN